MRLWEDYKKTMVQPETIWTAAKSGDLNQLQDKINNGIDINSKDNRGYSPLMLAAYSGDLITTEYLLRQGADPNSIDNAGNTVLMGSCFKGYLDITDILYRCGADIQRKNNAGMDAYEVATTFGRKEIVRYLETKGIQKNIKNRFIHFIRFIVFYFRSFAS
jgi:ankyrin repeat protein